MAKWSPHARLLSSSRWPSTDGICPGDPKEWHSKGKGGARWSSRDGHEHLVAWVVQGHAHEVYPRVQDDLQGTCLSYTLKTTGRILEKSLSGAQSLTQARVSLIFQEHRTMNVGSVVEGGTPSVHGQTSERITLVACEFRGKKKGARIQSQPRGFVTPGAASLITFRLWWTDRWIRTLSWVQTQNVRPGSDFTMVYASHFYR